MEIFIHIIKDLNRYLNLGIYLLVDADKIMLLSLATNSVLREYPSVSTLDLYNDLTELKRMISRWSTEYSTGRENAANYLKGQIYMKYRFDITNHYHPKKYGTF